MMIAHLPAGYIVAQTSAKNQYLSYRTILFAALLGSAFPDLDMIYFYLVDNRQTHHHNYITHWPLVYLATLLTALSLVKFGQETLGKFLIWFSVAALLHMVLDSVAAPMMWLAPFSNVSLELITIPATQPHWILSFILHWTFLFELTICALALILFFRRKRKES